MNVGAIGYEVHSGLGHLMRDFYQHGVLDRVLVVKHSHYPNLNTWYPKEKRFDRGTWRQFLDGLDVLLLFENAFVWQVPQQARSQGIKVVLIPNYEYTPYPIPVSPDLVLCASLLDVDYYRPLYRTEFLPIPVNTQRFLWRQRERAVTFIHNAGHGQRGFAKGTPQVIDAMRYVRSPVQLIVRGQTGESRIKELFDREKHNPRLELVYGDVPDEQLYAAGDVFINAEQYNGMSLMLQEARASGMLVMTTNRYPINTWLPSDPLFPVDHVEMDRQAVVFTRSIVTPEAIATKIDEWYNRDITEYSRAGRRWAEEHCWESLKPKYLETLGSLL